MDDEEFNLKIGEFVRIYREKKNFSIRKLEKKSGVSKAFLSRLEGSAPFKDSNPRILSLKSLLTALDKDFLDLFHYVYQKDKQDK